MTPALVKIPSATRVRKAPPLPGAAKLTKEARDWWRTVWASPMAVVWMDADVPALVRLAQMVDARARGEGNSSELIEIRQLEDRFGLSPLARRRLQWEIDQAGGAAQPEPVEGDGDERWLRAVKTG